MASRGELVTQIGRLVGRQDVNFATTIQGFLNQSIREFARLRPWIGLKRTYNAYATGQEWLVLPSWVERPLSVFDVTNIQPVEPGDVWDHQYPNALAGKTSGLPIEWRDGGTVPTVTDPSGEITIASDDSSDTATIRVTGFSHVSEASGTPLENKVIHESLTLTGTTPVTSTNSYVELFSISKDGDTTGDIVVRDSASTTLLAHLGAFEYETEYKKIEFLRVPAAGNKFEIRALRKPIELENDAQAAEPAIDGDFLIWNSAGLSLIALGERQAGIQYLQKARAIADQEDFKDKNFGDQALQMIPITEYRDSERRMVDG